MKLRVCPIFACPDNEGVIRLLNSCHFVYAQNLRAYKRAKECLDPKVSIILIPESNRLKMEEIAMLQGRPLEALEIVDVSDIMDAMK